MATFLLAPYNIATRTQAALTHSGMTKAELSRLAGVSYNQVRMILLGNRPAVSADTVRRLALALGCTTDFLLGIDETLLPGMDEDAC